MQTKEIIIIVAVLLIVTAGLILAINYFAKGNPIIGGEQDEHGCMTAAGYSYDTEVGACTRAWELDDNQKKAARISVAQLSFPVTVIEVDKEECEGCYSVKIQRNDNLAKIEVALKNWQISEIEEEKHSCNEEDRLGDFCTEEYAPVCGWFNQNIQCIKYPCAQTFSNKCFACHDENVAYWTAGECPE